MRLAAQTVIAALIAWPAALHAGPAEPIVPAPTLDVPYVSQSRALCGGASVAMVERYWGARNVRAEDFASLVDASGRGIDAAALVHALKVDGWTAYAMRGSMDVLAHHLSLGRPVIVLLDDGPDRLHYVVVTGLTAGAVVYHDPALLPGRTEAAPAFKRRWATTGNLMLLVLPPGPNGARPRTHRAVTPDRDSQRALAPACAADVSAGITLARGDRTADARERFQRAAASCPDSPSPLVELASLDLLYQDNRGASALARRALELDSQDSHAWQVLATAQYLLDRPEAALSAWNETGTPEVDLVRIDGLTRTRYGAVERYLGVPSGTLLTPRILEQGQRRLGDLPSAAATRLQFRPVGGGYADLDAGVVERRLLPTGRVEIGALGARAIAERELHWALGSPTRNGEAISTTWRWWTGREELSVDARVPLAGALRGVLGLGGRASTESFSSGSGGQAPTTEQRRGAVVSLGDWRLPFLRWEGRVGLDRWNSGRVAARLGAGLDVRLAADHLALALDGDAWSGNGAFGVATAAARWRSGLAASPVMLIDAGAALASSDAPRDLWPGAGTGHARPALLRAHPLLDDAGVIAGPAFGRQLVHVTTEGRVPVAAALLTSVHAALFVDVARTWQGPSPGRTLADAGVGLRFRMAGEGTLRVDAAHGLTDGANALSVAWEPPWPGRR